MDPLVLERIAVLVKRQREKERGTSVVQTKRSAESPRSRESEGERPESKKTPGAFKLTPTYIYAHGNGNGKPIRSRCSVRTGPPHYTQSINTRGWGVNKPRRT